ncbi:hypothetical protein U1Q18_000561, partial [Sarracenia purpurea var. burkii]
TIQDWKIKRSFKLLRLCVLLMTHPTCLKKYPNRSSNTMEKRNARNELVPTWMIEISYKTWTESYGSTLAYMASWLWSLHIATDHDQRVKKCRKLQMRVIAGFSSADSKEIL